MVGRSAEQADERAGRRRSRRAGGQRGAGERADGPVDEWAGGWAEYSGGRTGGRIGGRPAGRVGERVRRGCLTPSGNNYQAWAGVEEANLQVGMNAAQSLTRARPSSCAGCGEEMRAWRERIKEAVDSTHSRRRGGDAYLKHSVHRKMRDLLRKVCTRGESAGRQRGGERKSQVAARSSEAKRGRGKVLVRGRLLPCAPFLP